MASREALSIIRAARSGESAAQVALGKKYLFGGSGLARNIPTALYWLDRAALQGVAEAWRLIGRHVPSEVALRSGLGVAVLGWYERAHDAGEPQAGIELAGLVLTLPAHEVATAVRQKAREVLEHAASGVLPLLRSGPGRDAAEIEGRLERGALAGDSQARLALGLWLARIDCNGVRLRLVSGAAQYKRAIRWLLLAAEQGLADAAYALSKIYVKPEFSGRSVRDARLHLEHAALAGHGAAQHELGMSAWRNRRRDPGGDVRAACWLQKAAAQGIVAAAQLLDRIAPQPSPAPWAVRMRDRLTPSVVACHPALAARIELAAIFGLTRAEALMIDLRSADCAHCLLVDIRAGHGQRRLISMATNDARHALLRIVRRLEECGDLRAESDITGDHGRRDADAVSLRTVARGNYRQRLYRLKRLESTGMVSVATCTDPATAVM